MAYSDDFRWRGVVLLYVYNVALQAVSTVLGVSECTLSRWLKRFEDTGTVTCNVAALKESRWSKHVRDFVGEYVRDNPCFYFEELRHAIQIEFPSISNLTDATICRGLRFDLDLTRKKLTKRARECIPAERAEFVARLAPYYSGPSQLVFVDVTTKDGRSAMRTRAWSKRNEPAVVTLPFSRGKCISVLAATSSDGFLTWDCVEGTFTRQKFHDVFRSRILPFHNEWPLPRSIVVLDNAKILMYAEFQAMVHSVGAVLIFFPPYSPDLNPIEYQFSLLKSWISRHADWAFRDNPQAVMNIAL